MSGGLEWAAEQREAEEQYRKHVKSGKFNKNYLESDIVANLTVDETQLLVTRLIIHHLGGFPKYIKSTWGGFSHVWESLPKTKRKAFIKRQCLEYGIEVAPTKKIDKLRKKIKEMESLMHPRSEE